MNFGAEMMPRENVGGKNRPNRIALYYFYFLSCVRSFIINVSELCCFLMATVQSGLDVEDDADCKTANKKVIKINKSKSVQNPNKYPNIFFFAER